MDTSRGPHARRPRPDRQGARPSQASERAEGEPSPPAPGPLASGAEGGADLTPLVGRNLRRLRTGQGLSLERLARCSGVSRAMLGQIELGQSTPTINVLWKIALALDVPLTSLLLSAPEPPPSVVLRRGQAKVLSSHDGAVASRALFPFDAPPASEFYELVLRPGGRESSPAHPPGTIENLVVTSGRLEVLIEGASHLLDRGDAMVFSADRPHVYASASAEPTVVYLVVTRASPGRPA